MLFARIRRAAGNCLDIGAHWLLISATGDRCSWRIRNALPHSRGFIATRHDNLGRGIRIDPNGRCGTRLTTDLGQVDRFPIGGLHKAGFEWSRIGHGNGDRCNDGSADDGADRDEKFVMHGVK
jgi:hypothetical protein